MKGLSGVSRDKLQPSPRTKIAYHTILFICLGISARSIFRYATCNLVGRFIFCDREDSKCEMFGFNNKRRAVFDPSMINNQPHIDCPPQLQTNIITSSKFPPSSTILSQPITKTHPETMWCIRIASSSHTSNSYHTLPLLPHPPSLSTPSNYVDTSRILPWECTVRYLLFVSSSLPFHWLLLLLLVDLHRRIYHRRWRCYP